MIISGKINIPEDEVQTTAVRARGPGGQKVNKVSSAIHLRFDIRQSSLPDHCKTRLLKSGDKRINKRGIVIIKADQYRSQQKNRDAAIQRLIELIQSATSESKRRIPTRPTRASREERMDEKAKHSQLKRLRRKIDPDQ